MKNLVPNTRQPLNKHHARSVAVRKSANLGKSREWPVSLPGRFTRPERVSGTHWIGGRVGPRAGFDTVFTIKISAPTGNRLPFPWSSSPQPDDTDWTIPAPYTMRYIKTMLQSTVRLLTGTKTLMSVRNYAYVFPEWYDVQSSVCNASHLAISVQWLCNPCTFCGQIMYL